MKRVQITAVPERRFRSGRTSSMRVTMALLCWLTTACSDDRTDVTAARGVPSTATFEEPTELLDSAIDPGDSYLVTTAVTRTTTRVESAEPFTDPLTGQEVTSLTFPDIVDSTRFEAGYDAAGVVRINEYRQGNDSGGIAAHVQIAGNSATFFDASGAVVHDTAGGVLMDALGSMDNVVVTSSAVFREDTTPPGATHAALLEEADVGGQHPARVERRGDRLFQIYRLDDAPAGIRGERRRQFRRSGQEWIVMDERIQTLRETGGISFEVTETTTYPTVKWNINNEKDAARRARRSERSSTSGPRTDSNAGVASLLKSGSAGTNPSLSTSELSYIEPTCNPCGEEGGDTGGGDGGGGVDGRFGSLATVNLAFQHGALADARSWFRVDPGLSVRFHVANRVKPSLNWKASLESQARTLNEHIAASGAGRYLVIGHSNGGLIARRAAQMNAEAGAPLIGGVVAIASPHLGLPLASNTRVFVNTFLTAHVRNVLANIGFTCGANQFSWLCQTMDDAILTLVPNVVNYAFDSSVPMSHDVRVRSGFTTMLNARPEPFARYSVEVESQGAWKFVRLMGDWKCNPEDRCSGDHLQNTMESVYDVLRACGSNEFSKMVASSVADRCRNVRWSLSNLNLLYERLTAPGDASDGLVPAKSQAYPGIPLEDRAQLKRARASHSGELKSDDVLQKLAGFTSRYSKLSF